MGIDEEEMKLIKTDIETLKSIIKLIKKNIEKKGIGIEAWYKSFDEDLSADIEYKELEPMLESLKMSDKLEQRMIRMLFKLFDRHEQEYFTYQDFYDIVYGIMKPNYFKIVMEERKRFLLRGLDIKEPQRKPEVQPVPPP